MDRVTNSFTQQQREDAHKRLQNDSSFAWVQDELGRLIANSIPIAVEIRPGKAELLRFMPVMESALEDALMRRVTYMMRNYPELVIRHELPPDMATMNLGNGAYATPGPAAQPAQPMSPIEGVAVPEGFMRPETMRVPGPTWYDPTLAPPALGKWLAATADGDSIVAMYYPSTGWESAETGKKIPDVVMYQPVYNPVVKRPGHE